METSLGNEYYLKYVDYSGAVLRVIPEIYSLDYALADNKVTALNCSMSSDLLNELVKINGRFELWKSVKGSSHQLEGETSWFVRWPKSRRFVGAVAAYSAKYLLSGRIIAYAKGTAQASKSGLADDVMKDLVKENAGSSATDTNRSLDAYLKVQANLSKGATIERDFERRNLLSALQELADASEQAGKYIAFDIITLENANGSSQNMEFRTYLGQRGADRTATVVLDEETGSLTDVEVEEDWSDEINVVYVGGDGQGSGRMVSERSDLARAEHDPFARREGWQDAPSVNDADKLAAIGDASLIAGQPRRAFKAKVTQSSKYYGLDYKQGDLVTCRIRGEDFYSRVQAVKVKVDRGGVETVDIRLQQLGF